MDAEASIIQVQLQNYLSHPSIAYLNSEIVDLVEITAGWENDMYAFDQLVDDRFGERIRRELVLRIYPGDGGDIKSRNEFENMQRLHQSGYPVPEVFHLETDPNVLGKPFMIMERINGRSMWHMLNDPNAKKKEELLTNFCDLFVRLHNLDWRRFTTDPDIFEHGGAHLIESWLESAHSTLKQYPDTGLEPVLNWLEQEQYAVPISGPSIVHFDFHPNNILVRQDGTAFVIDWPALTVTDPRFDLGWTLILTDAYMGSTMRDRILQGYEHFLKKQVESVDFFLVSACARRIFDVSVSLSLGAEKLGMRPEAVEDMRRDYIPLKRVYNLLNEITAVRVEAFEELLDTIDNGAVPA